MTIELFDAKLTIVSCDYPPCDATTQSWASTSQPWTSSAVEDGWHKCNPTRSRGWVDASRRP